MDALLNDIKACRICHDLPLGPRPILQANPDARILIAGQAPGSITHKKGIPFDDPSGNRLRDWMGIDRGEFYDNPRIAIVPMGFCFPGTGKTGDFPPRPECAPKWRQPVLDHFEQLELTLIIGRYAVDWHLPHLRKSTITAAVQDWENHWPNQLVMPHPSPRNNRWLKTNPWFETQIIPKLQARIKTLLG